MTLAELNDKVTCALRSALGDSEGRATARLVMEDLANATPTRIFTRGEYVLEPETVQRVDRAVQRIVNGEPPQYAVGTARWMGMDFIVTPATLIPRPETAGLVDLITDDYNGRSDLRVLDIGTGSGCIAIALSRALPFSHVKGIDISPDALKIARENASRLHTNVTFEQADILNTVNPSPQSLDIIVSNPPYIPDGEIDEVDGRVARYEPHNALFVPDDNPLVFYKAIANYGNTALATGGRIYFEINPHYASQLRDMLTSNGYSNVEILRDSFGKLRFARAIRL